MDKASITRLARRIAKRKGNTLVYVNDAGRIEEMKWGDDAEYFVDTNAPRVVGVYGAGVKVSDIAEDLGVFDE